MSVTPASRPARPVAPAERPAPPRVRGVRALVARIGEAARAAHTASVPF